MDYPTFLQLVSESPEPFFAAWELTEPPSSEWSSFVPFLRLLRTEAILTWAKSFSPLKNNRRWATAVMPTLLERHVLPVAHRRRPEMIGDFWRWAVPFSSSLARLWEEAELPTTLDPKLNIAQQEEHFAVTLWQAADKVAQEIGPDHWAVKTLQQLARRRGLLSREFAENAEAHVVFGFDQPPAALRSGLIVPFRLLALCGSEIDIHPSHVFADDFLDALREHVRRRVRNDELRSLEHDWDFLGDKSLTGTSGTMAIWLAQFLAAGGLRDDRWTLPPWVLVTATLDRQGHGPGGTAGTVGLLRSKAEIALEEGVRVLVVASETGSTDNIESEIVGLPGYMGLSLLPVRAGDDGVVHLARELQKFCWPVRFDAVGTDLHSTTTEDERDLIDDRRDPHIVVPESTDASSPATDIPEKHLREWERDYIPPTFALRAIEAARRDLPGRGYLHVTAPPMWGKSFLVLALRHGWKPVTESASLGNTLSYSILHGRPENPGDFLLEIFDQAKQQAGERAFANFHTPPHQQRTDDDTRRAVRDMLAVAHQSHSLRGRPLMLAIDALDEITADDKDSNRSLILDFLPRAEELPDGCYILLTSRPELRPKVWQSLAERVGTNPATYYRRIDFEIDSEHRQLLREFLLKSFGDPIRPHLDTVLARGQERFLYVSLLRDLLRLWISERGEVVLRDLHSGELPEANEVFPTYLDWLARTVDSQAADLTGSLREPNVASDVSGPHSATSLFNNWHRPALLLIAAAYEPITHEHLCCWLGIRDWKDDRESHQLNLALDNLARLLRTDRPPELPNTSRFTLAHRELLEWLKNNQHPQWQSALRDEAHRRIAETADCQVLPSSVADFTPIDLYHFLHVPSHWLAIDDHAAAWRGLFPTGEEENWEAAYRLVELADFYSDRWLWRQVVGILDCRISQLEPLISAGQTTAVPDRLLPAQMMHLAYVYTERAEARQAQQDFLKSLEDCGLAIGLCEAFPTAFRRVGPFLNTEIRALMIQGATHLYQQEFIGALSVYNQVISLLEITSSDSDEHTLAIAYSGRGIAHRGQQDFDGAISDYNHAINLIERSPTEFGGVDSAATAEPQFVTDLAGTYLNRGVARLCQEDVVGAITDADRAIKLIEARLMTITTMQTAVTAKPALVRQLAGAYLNRGSARESQQDFIEAMADFSRAIGHLESLVKAFGGTESALMAQPLVIRDLATAYLNRGRARNDQQDFLGAAADYDQAINLREALLGVMRQFGLGDFLTAINIRSMLHAELKDIGLVTTMMRGLTIVVQCFREIGCEIRLSTVRQPFKALDGIFTIVGQSITVDHSMRTAWNEVRALFAEE